MMSATATTFARQYFHGSRADLPVGAMLTTGHRSNFTDTGGLSWVYVTATLDAAIWGAELAAGDGAERIYLVEPTGEIEDDPNVTDKKFPGNPTLSFRSRDPMRIVAEVTGWQGHAPGQVQQMRDGLAKLRQSGAPIID